LNAGQTGSLSGEPGLGGSATNPEYPMRADLNPNGVDSIESNECCVTTNGNNSVGVGNQRYTSPRVARPRLVNPELEERTPLVFSNEDLAHRAPELSNQLHPRHFVLPRQMIGAIRVSWISQCSSTASRLPFPPNCSICSTAIAPPSVCIDDLG